MARKASIAEASGVSVAGVLVMPSPACVVLRCCEQMDRVSPGKDPRKVLFAIYHEAVAAATLPHTRGAPGP
jgi:hypothetical protein